MTVLVHSVVYPTFIPIKAQLNAVREVFPALPCCVLGPSPHPDEVPDSRLTPSALVAENGLVDVVSHLSPEGRLQEFL